MGDWKSQAPPALAVPSYTDAIDPLNSDGGRKHPQTPFSTGGVQTFPILTPESLLSPADRGFLYGASSLARVGLDIGGTLCKVVYFEPEVNFAKDPLMTWNQSKTAGFISGIANGKMGKDSAKPGDEGDRSDVNGDSQPRDGGSGDLLTKSTHRERNGSAGNGINKTASVVRVTDGNAKELMTVSVDQFTTTNTSSTDVLPASPMAHNARHSVENFKISVGNGRTSESVSESCQRISDIPAVQVFDQDKDDRTSKGAGASEDDQESRRKIKKLWVSSHEPVYLPGRGTLYFKCFETWRMEEFLNLTKEYHLMIGGRAIGATGGGARKFGDQFLDIAGLQLQRADELKSLVRGIDFLARHAQQESFEFPTGSYQGGSIQRPWQSPDNSSDDSSDLASEEDFSLIQGREESESEIPVPNMQAATGKAAPPQRQKKSYQANTPTLKEPVLAKLDSGYLNGSNEAALHPYLVVNIGSGVSMLRVDSPDEFERVGGTSLGGSTFLGLANALTGCQSFEEAITLASNGDSTHVDLLVGDIYGGDYTEMGLAATTIASSFGKLVLPQRSEQSQNPQHLAKAALLMVTNNIGSIALLHARNAGVHSIMFTGSFLHNNKLAMRLLAVALEFWSKGNMKAVFLRHEGHAGAMGALLSALESSNPLDNLLLT